MKWAFSLFFPMWFIAHCISRLSQLPMIRIWTIKWHYYFIMIANIVGLFLGIFMLIRPVAALISLSYLIGIDLILLGIDSVILAFSRMGSAGDPILFIMESAICSADSFFDPSATLKRHLIMHRHKNKAHTLEFYTLA